MRLPSKLRSSVAAIAVAAPATALLAACGSSPATSASGSKSVPPTTGTSVPPSSSSSSSSSSTTSTTAAAKFNSCSAVTQAEAAAALGQSVSAGVLGNATVEGGLACVFYGPTAANPHTPNTPQMDSVRVVVVEGANALNWYENYKSTVPAQAISGYGDQAYYDGDASLSVMKGDDYLRIAVWPADAAPSLADEERLAAAILPNL